MEYNDEYFSIKVTDNRMEVTGKMEKADFNQVDKFLDKVDKSVKAKEMVLDLRKLQFINSSGIRSLAVFFLKSNKYFKIHINRNVSCQEVGFVPLSNIKEKGIITVYS